MKKVPGLQATWWEEIPAAITITAEDGTILAMNARSAETFAAEGGKALIGTNVLDCHPEPARARTLQLYKEHRENHYTIRKDGRMKMIHQLPWYRDGIFQGLIELSVPIPDPLPHFDRD